MLASLKYEVTFPSTGRTLSGDFSFQKGFGAITGPNEAGKSVILEMIRFALFGTKALRGKSEDYKNLKVDLVFVVRGETYRSNRTIATAKLFRDGKEITTGVRGVNNKIVELLGFGLQVFDVACVANQGDIEKLGAMLPTERKQMVDSVIGLSVIDELTKWCADEARSIASAVEGIEETLVEPEKPMEPQDYCGSDRLQPDLEDLRKQRDELNHLQGWLSHTKEDPGDLPAAPTDMTSEELEELVEQAQAYESAQKELARLPEPPPVDPDDVNIDDWESRENIRRNYPTTMSADQIAQADAAMELARKFEHLDHLQTKLEDLLAVGTHTCPECDHQWPMEQDRVEKVRSEISQLEDVLKDEERPHRPDMINIDTARRQLQAFETVRAEWERVKDTPKPEYTRQQLAQFKVAKDAQARRAELDAVKPSSATSKELNGLWRERLAYEQRLSRYEEESKAYAEWQAECAKKAERAEELASVPERLTDLERRYEESRIFEDRWQAYEKAIGIYCTKKAEVEARRLEEEGYRKGREALAILRKLVKQHLIPSLNKVASHYLSKMTGGQRNLIEVSDEFDIQVDGQPINTLSGSGKAVANLSLRLGLGQVLTNNQFSIFLGDEIDASMDEDRAKNTSLTLEYLKDRISQILLVSHKYPQADYYIELEEHEAHIN